jgi:hypothetical protein
MLFTCFPLSVFNCPSVLCSSAHAWHKSVPNLQCKYTPSFFLQSKQNLFSDDDDEEEEEEEEEEGANTDSCIVWRMNKFRGPTFLLRPLPLRPFVFPIVVIVVSPTTLAWVIFLFFLAFQRGRNGEARRQVIELLLIASDGASRESGCGAKSNARWFLKMENGILVLGKY